MKETPTLGKEIWPYGADAGKALRNAQGKLKVYNVRNAADRPYKLFSRSGSWFGTAGEEQELSRRYVNSLGEPIDYDEKDHDLDEETDVTANYGPKSPDRTGEGNPDYIRTLTNPNRSTLGAFRHDVGNIIRTGGDPDFAATFHQTNIGKTNQLYAQKAEDEQFREATSTALSRGDASAYATPADNVRSSAQTQAQRDYLEAQQAEDEQFRQDTSTDVSLGERSGYATPADNVRSSAQGPSALPWQGAQRSTLLGMDPNKMSQSQYMNSRGMPTAAQFDDYLNQSLRDPNSSINAGLASMRARSGKPQASPQPASPAVASYPSNLTDVNTPPRPKAKWNLDDATLEDLQGMGGTTSGGGPLPQSRTMLDADYNSLGSTRGKPIKAPVRITPFISGRGYGPINGGSVNAPVKAPPYNLYGTPPNIPNKLRYR